MLDILGVGGGLPSPSAIHIIIVIPFLCLGHVLTDGKLISDKCNFQTIRFCPRMKEIVSHCE